MPHLLCFGYGYTAQAVCAKLAPKKYWKCYGTHRQLSQDAPHSENGGQPRELLFDGKNSLAEWVDLSTCVTHILISIPPDDEGDAVFDLHGSDFISCPNLEWVGYISATSVYGDHEGAWVDETSLTCPETQRGMNRLTAENNWRRLFMEQGLPVHIFRSAGIYGPGRSVIDRIAAGKKPLLINKPGHMFNRIHRDDLADILIASMQNPEAGALYNCADGYPASQLEVNRFAYHLFGLTPPPVIEWEAESIPPQMRSFYQENKKIRAEKIHQKLIGKLQYTSYEKGLQDIYHMTNKDLRQVS